MNISKSMTQGEYATCIMMLLTSYDSSHFVADLIEKKQLGKLKLQQRRNVLCILSRLLKDQAVMGDEDETIIDPILFKAITKASAVFVRFYTTEITEFHVSMPKNYEQLNIHHKKENSCRFLNFSVISAILATATF